MSKEAILAALKRRAPGIQRQVRDRRMARLQDWRGTCKRCGQEVQGTIAQMEEHSEACRAERS